MNIHQAKRIRITDIMTFLGYEPVKKERGGTELKYLSPFHAEENPSCNVNINRNSFFDFSMGEGGNALDLAILLLKSSGKSARVSDALAFLEQIGGGMSEHTHIHSLQKSFSFSQPKLANDPEIDDEERQLVFIRAMKLTSKRILDYLENERCIPVHLAQKYLHTVQYQNLKKPRPDDRPYFAFGMQNRSSGWEIRSASDVHQFKSALIKRDITIIKGGQGYDTVHIFEGMLDFISSLTLENKSELNSTAIIMHSTSSFSTTCDFIKENSFNHICTWLDNDRTGEKFTDLFKEAFASKIRTMNHIYNPAKDVNAHLKTLHLHDINSPKQPIL